jgi:hypothetical protein
VEEISSDRAFTDQYESHSGGFSDGFTNEISLHKMLHSHHLDPPKRKQKQSTKHSLRPKKERIPSSRQQKSTKPKYSPTNPAPHLSLVLPSLRHTNAFKSSDNE